MRALPSRLSILPLALSAIVACRSEPAQAIVPADPDCPLRAELEGATRAPDPAVRRAAVRVLGNRGSGSSVDIVGELLADPDESVAVAAVEALAEMDMRGGDHRARAAVHLARAVRGAPSRVRYFALNALGDCREAAAGQLDTIRACLVDQPTETQVAAAIAWGEIGASEGFEACAVELIQQNAGGPWDYSLAQLLPFLRERASVAAFKELLGSANANVRFQAECARARLEDGGSPRIAEAQLEERWSSENHEAIGELQRASWKRVPQEVVEERAAHARLVLCGEMHMSEGPIRDSQCALLHAFVRQPAFEAIGFEPSVEDSQGSVLQLARSLGLETIPLETNWRELNAQDRSGARELETLAIIEHFLGEDPRRRLFVLRGESHVVPGGFLVRRLDVKPLVILSGSIVNVPLQECGLRCKGSVFEIGASGSVYSLPYDEPSTAEDLGALERWLAVPSPRTP